MASSRAEAHFSGRRRTAIVLAGEGTAVGYLAGVMKALGAAGARIDLVMGRGAGALVAVFSAIGADERIHGKHGILDELQTRRPFRFAILYRVVAICLALAFAAFVAPALLGLVSVVVLPLHALLRGLAPRMASPASGFLEALMSAVEPFYLPAVALPVIILFTVVSIRWLVSIRSRRGPFSALARGAIPPPFDLGPLARVLEGRLWEVVRGASPSERPKSRRELGEAYVQLLTASLGQPGFRELLFYVLDTDTGEEVPFVILRERFSKKMNARAGAGRAEPIELQNDASSLLFDALVASMSPPGLVGPVPMKLPSGSRFGGEVHRFASSLTTGEGALADAVAAGAEQIVYVSAAAPSDRLSGSLWERLAGRALRISVEKDLLWASENSEVPVFLIRPDTERLLPFEVSGRAQLGNERLLPNALVAQGERDCERLFIRPVLGEDLGGHAAPESTVPIARKDWEAGPKEL